MKKVNRIVLTAVAVYLLAAPCALGQLEKAAEAKGGQVQKKISGLALQAPCDWHLIYPGTTAFYVGGTVKGMYMHKDSVLEKP